MSERGATYETERLPDPSAEQVALAMEMARRALAGEEVRLYSDEKGRLCAVPVRRGEVERVS